MAQPINKETLRKLRESKGFDQKRLAELTGLRNDSISRMERGEQTGASAKTQAKLAKALGVEPEALTREIDLQKPDSFVEQSSINRRVTFSRREWQTWEAVSVGYGVSWLKILKFAPALFAICAEQSLRQRAGDLETVAARARELTEAGTRLEHLGAQRLPRWGLEEMIEIERQSISKRDIFAQSTLDAIDFDLHDNAEMPRDPENPDAIFNPFIAFVREAAKGVGLEVFRDRSDPDEVVLNHEDAWFDSITAGDLELNRKLAVADIFLHDLPRELRMKDRLEDRKSWLRDRMETDPYILAKREIDDSFLDGLATLVEDQSNEVISESADV